MPCRKRSARRKSASIVRTRVNSPWSRKCGAGWTKKPGSTCTAWTVCAYNQRTGGGCCEHRTRNRFWSPVARPPMRPDWHGSSRHWPDSLNKADCTCRTFRSRKLRSQARHGHTQYSLWYPRNGATKTERNRLLAYSSPSPVARACIGPRADISIDHSYKFVGVTLRKLRSFYVFSDMSDHQACAMPPAARKNGRYQW